MTISLALDGSIFSRQRSGGITSYSVSLINSFVEMGLQVKLYTSLAKPKNQEFSTFSVEVFQSFSLIDMISFSYNLAPDKCDVCHTPYYMIPRSASCPSVVTVHDFIDEFCYGRIESFARRSVKWRAIRSADALVCISESTRNDLLRFYQPKSFQSVYVVHNGVSEAFRPTSTSLLNIDDSSFPDNYILYVGSRARYKNFSHVLESLLYLDGIDLVCVGGSEMLVNEIDSISHKLRGRVKHLSYVSDCDLNHLYNGAICLVYPSSYEGFGLPIIEAMRTRTPIIISNTPALLEVCGSYAIVLKTVSAHEIASSIRALLSSHQYSLDNALQFSKRYSWSISAASYSQIYTSLL